jgi:muramoyltetrapeptide carboxypeptidase
MILPKPIQPGDKIRIVSPAGKLKEKRVLPAAEWLRNQGYEVETGIHTFAKHYEFAGTNEQRLEDLQLALNDSECKVILCSRGGYGTVRLIDKLDFNEFLQSPKWIVGYSDITILHLAMQQKGFASIHGTMPPLFFDKNGNPNENLTSLMKVLAGNEIMYEFSADKKRTGKAVGELIGGNLAIITSMLGTEFEIETEGRILFLEDIGEYLYRIDRMIHQLNLAGKLKNLAGLVIGDFTDNKDNDSPFGQSVEEIIWEAIKEYDFPVSFGLKAGHDDVNWALPFGTKCELNVSDEKSTLNIKLETLN